MYLLFQVSVDKSFRSLRKPKYAVWPVVCLFIVSFHNEIICSSWFSFGNGIVRVMIMCGYFDVLLHCIIWFFSMVLSF